MRRWFKIAIDDAGIFHRAPPRVWDTSLVYFMPHIDQFIDWINNAGFTGCYLTYDITKDGDPDLCYGLPTALCIGQDGTPHAYEPQFDQNLSHSHQPYDASDNPIVILAQNVGPVSSFSLSGFLAPSGFVAGVFRSGDPTEDPDGA